MYLLHQLQLTTYQGCTNKYLYPSRIRPRRNIYPGERRSDLQQQSTHETCFCVCRSCGRWGSFQVCCRELYLCRWAQNGGKWFVFFYLQFVFAQAWFRCSNSVGKKRLVQGVGALYEFGFGQFFFAVCGTQSRKTTQKQRLYIFGYRVTAT